MAADHQLARLGDERVVLLRHAGQEVAKKQIPGYSPNRSVGGVKA